MNHPASYYWKMGRRGGAGRVVLWIICGLVTGASFWIAFCFHVGFSRMRGTKITRVKRDMRDPSLAINEYRGKNHAWPPTVPFTALPQFQKIKAGLDRAGGLTLTTFDPTAGMQDFPEPHMPGGTPYAYFTAGKGWILSSPGPDGKFDFNPVTQYSGDMAWNDPRLLAVRYDPTNGMFSGGDLFRTMEDSQ